MEAVIRHPSSLENVHFCVLTQVKFYNMTTQQAFLRLLQDRFERPIALKNITSCLVLEDKLNKKCFNCRI